MTRAAIVAALASARALVASLEAALDEAPTSTSTTTYDCATAPGGPRTPRAWREWLAAHGVPSTGRGRHRVALVVDVDRVVAAPRPARAPAPAAPIDPIAQRLRLVGAGGGR